MEKRHSIIEKLLKRKDKEAPFNDERKIGLVLLGGCMSGVVGAGAVTALEKLGLSQSFDVIYSASAGFANASYMLTENTEIGSSIYYEELKNRNFINFLKIWKPVNFNRVIESIKTYKRLDYKKIWETKTEFYLKVADIFRNAFYVNINRKKSSDYFTLLREAISFPFLSTGVSIKGKRYFDGQMTNKETKEFLLYVLDSDCTDILIVYNTSEQCLLDIPKSDRIFEIIPDKDISIFETNESILKEACFSMRDKIINIFSNN